MCGLTGVALSPKASHEARTLAGLVLNDMLVRTESRGSHATGLAVQSAHKRHLVRVVKKAEPARAFVGRKEYKSALDAIADGFGTVAIGHTRYATQGAAHLDENAHPFQFGKVTGAHNGIITNWRDIERDLRKRKRKEAERGFRVDSEAAFALLNAETDPVTALEALQGYFALTWLRGGLLHFARTDAPLVVAYVKSLRAMFWNSEEKNVLGALAAAGVKVEDESDVIRYSPTPGTIYQFDATKFDGDGTNVAHIGKFSFSAARRDFNWSRPSLGGGAKATRRRVTSGATETVLPWKDDAPTTPREKPRAHDLLANDLGGDRVYSFPEMTRKLNEAGRRVIASEARIKKLEREALARSSELTMLRARLDALCDFVGVSPSDLVLDLEPEADDTPYRSRHDDASTYAAHGGICEVCHFSAEPGAPLVHVEDYGFVHSRCAPAALRLTGREDDASYVGEGA